jgi:hypothetical protein
MWSAPQSASFSWSATQNKAMLKSLVRNLFGNRPRDTPPLGKSRYTIVLRDKASDEWRRQLGISEFPVTSNQPVMAEVLGERQLVFFLDLTRIDFKTRDRLEHYLAHRYCQTLDEVRHEIAHGGVPIFARGLRTPDGLEI